jgi:hypothetical protein
MTTDVIVVERLRRLHEDYVERVNMAVAEDRQDLVDALARAYDDDALRVVASGEGAGRGVEPRR